MELFVNSVAYFGITVACCEFSIDDLLFVTCCVWGRLVFLEF